MTNTDGMPNAETLAAMAESNAAMMATKGGAGQRTKTASPVRSYRDLLVWQKGMELTELVYAVAKLMPKKEQYRITSQMLRSAASVPANIAEGNQRGTRRDYANFVSIARGSLAETETFLLMACRVGLLSEEAVNPSLALADELSRMLRTLRQKLVNPAKPS